MEVSLSPKLEALVQEKIDAGLYRNVSEVIGAALLLMAKYEQEQERKLAVLRQAVQIGIDQADRGEFAEGFSIETLMKEADSGE